MPSVPRVYEKVHAAITAASTRRGRAAEADRLGRGRRRARRPRSATRRAAPAAARRAAPAGDQLVFSKVQERLGGRLRLAVSGGAPLATEIAEFFHALDILILEGYGLTECTSGVHVQPPGPSASAPSGRPLPGFEVRIAEDGEILVRGPTSSPATYKRRGGDARGPRRGGLAPHRRHRHARRRRLPHDHRSQEGPHRHRGREERGAAEPRERPEAAKRRSRMPGRRRPASLPGRADPRRESSSVAAMGAGRLQLATDASARWCRRRSTRSTRDATRHEQIRRFTCSSASSQPETARSRRR